MGGSRREVLLKRKEKSVKHLSIFKVVEEEKSYNG